MTAGPPGPTPLLEVRGLCVDHEPRQRAGGRRRGAFRAVDGVDLDVFPGETLGLVGESGCGKTSAARAILRLLRPSAGTVRFRGEDVGRLDRRGLRRFRRKAQMVFQDPFGSLNPRLTVRAMLEEALLVHGLGRSPAERRRRAEALLERVGLSSRHGERFPHELSGGQRQRVGIARALSVEPELLVCDEPVSALDVSVRAQVVNLLRDLQDELGIACLFIAHDLAVVEHVSHRVAVMYLGRIVETAPTDRLYRDPRHPYTRALLSAVPLPDPMERRRQRIVLRGEIPAGGPRPHGCPFHARCPHPLKDAECVASEPSLEAKAPGHFAACWKEPPDPERGG